LFRAYVVSLSVKIDIVQANFSERLNMLLINVLDQVMMERDLQPITESQYRKAITEYSSFLGRAATVSDLCYTEINRWLKSMKGTLDPVTIVNRKKGLTVVWNYLAELGQTEYYHSKRLFTPKVPPKPVVSWSIRDFDILVAAARNVRGEYHGIPNNQMLHAWLWVGFDTAFRPSDMHCITWDSVDFKACCIAKTQHKTGVPHRAQLSTTSLKALKAIMAPARELVFPLKKDELRYPLEYLYREAAKIGFVKIQGRSIGTLRRLHATIQYEDHGASVAAESLGHVGGTRTVMRSYVDHRSRRQGRLPRHESNRDKPTERSDGSGK
jgi:site-specific recombinase XerD